jgi:ABC-2 type transport system ATP-binding protein
MRLRPLGCKNPGTRYGTLAAVKNPSPQVFESQVFGLLSPNGAGKTTSINMIGGLLKPDSGQVLIHGRPINDHEADIRARVGVCPQNMVLWNTLHKVLTLDNFTRECYIPATGR